jgi:hypothetical protein
MSGAGLAELSDASHFYDGGFLLPFCKANGFFTIGVDATKGFAVIVKHSDLPVTVLAPIVFPECCGFPNFHLEKYITLNSLSTNELPMFPCLFQKPL